MCRDPGFILRWDAPLALPIPPCSGSPSRTAPEEDRLRRVPADFHCHTEDVVARSARVGSEIDLIQFRVLFLHPVGDPMSNICCRNWASGNVMRMVNSVPAPEDANVVTMWIVGRRVRDVHPLDMFNQLSGVSLIYRSADRKPASPHRRPIQIQFSPSRICFTTGINQRIPASIGG
jgi:hypothetical protein